SAAARTRTTCPLSTRITRPILPQAIHRRQPAAGRWLTAGAPAGPPLDSPPTQYPARGLGPGDPRPAVPVGSRLSSSDRTARTPAARLLHGQGTTPPSSRGGRDCWRRTKLPGGAATPQVIVAA